MSKAYVMLGRIACGKSYFAEQIAKEKGGVILSCDEIIWALFDGCLGDKLMATEERAIKYLLYLAKQIGQNGGDVIIDCGLCSAAQRTQVVNNLKLCGFEIERILVKCDEATRHARLNRRNLQRSGSKNRGYVLPYEKVLDIEQARYDEPKPNEYDTLIQND